MKFVNILYKNNPYPVSLASEKDDDARKVFDTVLRAKKDSLDILLITSPSGYIFIDPSQVTHCEISNKSFNPK